MSSRPIASGPGHRALRSGRVSLAGHVYHVTTSTHLRQPLFADFGFARVVIRSLNAPQLLKGTELIAWVLMPDHLHVLLQLGETDSLDAYVDRMKCATARSLNRLRNFREPVWQRAYHDHLLRQEEDLKTVARYIIMNPLRAGIVSRISAYPHWDAMWVDGRA